MIFFPFDVIIEIMCGSDQMNRNPPLRQFMIQHRMEDKVTEEIPRGG
jgi:hypothetical protein